MVASPYSRLEAEWRRTHGSLLPERPRPIAWSIRHAPPQLALLGRRVLVEATPLSARSFRSSSRMQRDSRRSWVGSLGQLATECRELLQLVIGSARHSDPASADETNLSTYSTAHCSSIRASACAPATRSARASAKASRMKRCEPSGRVAAARGVEPRLPLRGDAIVDEREQAIGIAFGHQHFAARLVRKTAKAL